MSAHDSKTVTIEAELPGLDDAVEIAFHFWREPAVRHSHAAHWAFHVESVTHDGRDVTDLCRLSAGRAIRRHLDRAAQARAEECV